METTGDFWKKCSACKKPIGFNQTYYVCSVSTCTGQRTGYQFCTVFCWDTHVGEARHKNAGAVEKKSPTKAQAEASGSGGVAGSGSSSASSGSGSTTKSGSGAAPARRIIPSGQVSGSSFVVGSGAGGVSAPKSSGSREVLIVASKLKDYIRDCSEMNTSAAVMDVLSDYVRMRCDEAIENARREGRKTVLDRDFKFSGK